METGQRGKAIPFVLFSNKRFIITDEAKELFSNNYKNIGIGIISLVGKYRTGKSFLLNRVLLNEKREHGFNVGPTIKACTKGIWMWTEPKWVENNHSLEKFPVFMIDTEGLGAYDEEVNHDTKIFLIAILISSLFIYNSFGNIDENSINSLSFILNLSKTIKLSENPHKHANKTETNSELAKYFPSFLWLLRDFSLKLEDNSGNAITAKEYLESALFIHKGNSNFIEEKNKVRKMINTYFPDRDCFSLVRPVEDEVNLQNLQTLDDSDIRKEFLEQASALRESVFSKVKPKIFNGKILSGNMLIDLLSSVLDSINQGAIPVIENSWKYVVQSESMKNINDINNEYRQKIQKFKEENSTKLTFFNDFEIFRKSLEKNLIEEFQKSSISQDSSQIDYIILIKSKFEEESKRFNEENIKFFEKKLSENLEENLKIINEGFEANKYSKNHFQFFHELENAKEASDASTPDFPSKNEKIFEKIILTIKKFIEGTFVKNKIQNEKEILTLKSEQQSIQNKYNLKCEELEFLSEESNIQNESLNNQLVEFKLKEKFLEEKIKEMENKKRIYFTNTDNKISELKREYENKIDILSKDMGKVDEDLKAKEECVLNMQITEKKLTALNNQKIEFMEKEISTLKERSESLRKDNSEYRRTIDELLGKIDELKSENNKKKYLEAEIDRMKKEKDFNYCLGLDQADYPEHERAPISYRIRDSMSFNNTNSELVSMLRSQITMNRNHYDEMKNMYGNIIHTLKSNSSGIDIVNNVNLNDGINNIVNSSHVKNLCDTNKILSETLQNYELKHFRIKEKKFKLKNILKNSATLQCKTCAKNFHYKNFKLHLSKCSDVIGRNSLKNEGDKEKYKMKISKGIIIKDGYNLYPCVNTCNDNGPNIEFVIGVNYNDTKWILNKGLNHIQSLQKTFNKAYPNLKFDLFNLNITTCSKNTPRSSGLLNEFHKNILQVEKFLNLMFKSKPIRESQMFLNFIEYDQYYHVLDPEELGDITDKASSHIKRLSECNFIEKEKFTTDFNFSANTQRGIDYNTETEDNVRYTSNFADSYRKDSNISKESGVNQFSSSNKKAVQGKNYETATVLTKQESRTDFKKILHKNLVRNKKKSCSVDLNPKNEKDSYVTTAISKIKEFIYNLFMKIKQH